MQVATALEQFALLGVVFDGDGVDRVILRIAQLQSAYLAHQRRTVSMTAVHAVATEAAPFVIAMIGRRAAAVLAGTVGGLLRVGGGDRKSVVEGKSVSVRVVIGGGRVLKKKKHKV